MPNILKAALWNANGLVQHSQEVKTFLTIHDIDIMLISEAHLKSDTYLKIPRYSIYATPHPDGTAHAGTAVIVKSKIKHYELQKFQEDYLQATTIAIKENHRDIVFSAVYCPPRHNIKKQKFASFFDTLGPCFIAGGDYNSKNQIWGSRITLTRGRELSKAAEDHNLQYLSTFEPTYWPTDLNKTPDLLDFCITKGVSSNYLKATSCLDLSSDHSPVLITYSTHVLQIQKPPTLSTRRTNWDHFRELVTNRIRLTIPLKTENDLFNAIEHLNESIQQSSWDATPNFQTQQVPEYGPIAIKQKIAEKRRLRRIWQITRNPRNKTKLNQSSRELKSLLTNFKNQGVQEYLTNLTPTETTDEKSVERESVESYQKAKRTKIISAAN